MEGVTVTIRDVQAVLLNMFSNKTILIGHSLESDFKALKVTSPILPGSPDDGPLVVCCIRSVGILSSIVSGL